ncbi:hypothetical protein QUV58_09890 [Succinatimonas hippei]|nr:hypothetical protein [Succinatimonas hippei]MDM8121116.1 hypothetical protein [Succinatimonas hippei]
MDALPPESCWQGLCSGIVEEVDNSRYGARGYLSSLWIETPSK